MRPCENAENGCEGEVGDRSKFDLCPNCRARKEKWKARTPADILRRHHNLTCWDSTLPLPGKVTSLTTHTTRTKRRA